MHRGLNGTLKHPHMKNVAGVAAVRRVAECTPDPEFLFVCGAL